MGFISKKSMNEDSVALIMCEKCEYNKKQKDLELSADFFLKDTSCFTSFWVTLTMLL